MTRRPRAATHWGAPEAAVSTLSLALLVYLLVQRTGFDELIGLSRLQLSGEEPWLLPASVISTSLIALLPAGLTALALQRLSLPRASRACFVGLASLALFLLTLDLDQCIFVLLVGDPYFKKTVGHERNANHGNKQPGIFQEEAAADFPLTRHVRLSRRGAIRHSITSSAAKTTGSTLRAAGAGGGAATPLRTLRNSRRLINAPLARDGIVAG